MEKSAFNEKEYLEANPDVADAVRKGQFKSGWQHYVAFGEKEERRLRLSELSREDKALFCIDKQGIGLEIGPSYSPIASKSKGFNVHIVDHLNTAELRNKYTGHNVDIDKIEEVDYIWSGQPLSQLIGKQAFYDYIIASHVVEHVPDLITFLQECHCMLKPDGVLSLIIPDKRYCFDHFNKTSSTGDFLNAYADKRIRPSVGQVFDHFANAVKYDGQICWANYSSQGNFNLIHSFDQARQIYQQSCHNNEYIDVHCWRFTPGSIRLALNDLNLLGLFEMELIKEFNTSGCEFYVSLSKAVNTQKATESERFSLLRGEFDCEIS